jgi:hypothetical protein
MTVQRTIRSVLPSARAVAAAAVLGLAAVPATASITYTFDSPGGPGATSFTLVTDDYITADTVFSGADFAACQVAAPDIAAPTAQACGTVRFVVDPQQDGFSIAFAGAPSVSAYFADRDGLSASGAIAGVATRAPRATLVVSGTPTPSTGVPEPATWSLMIFGFGAIGFAMRRKTVLRFV